MISNDIPIEYMNSMILATVLSVQFTCV